MKTLTHLTANPRGFYLALMSLKGRSASSATPLEQAGWVNQTVPLSFYGKKYNTN